MNIETEKYKTARIQIVIQGRLVIPRVRCPACGSASGCKVKTIGDITWWKCRLCGKRTECIYV